MITWTALFVSQTPQRYGIVSENVLQRLRINRVARITRHFAG